MLTPEERSEIARNAVKARWAKAGKLKAELESQPAGEAIIAPPTDATPYSMFQGTMKIGELELECHVLNDFRRVFTQREVVRILSGGRESGQFAALFGEKPLIFQ